MCSFISTPNGGVALDPRFCSCMEDFGDEEHRHLADAKCFGCRNRAKRTKDANRQIGCVQCANPSCQTWTQVQLITGGFCPACVEEEPSLNQE